MVFSFVARSPSPFFRELMRIVVVGMVFSQSQENSRLSSFAKDTFMCIYFSFAPQRRPSLSSMVIVLISSLHRQTFIYPRKKTAQSGLDGACELDWPS